MTEVIPDEKGSPSVPLGDDFHSMGEELLERAKQAARRIDRRTRDALRDTDHDWDEVTDNTHAEQPPPTDR